jgi:tetratricopeptide (TPR) repeat protein
MFRFFFKKAAGPKTLRERALAAVARREFGQADAAFTRLLADTAALPMIERAFLFNKRGVARIGLARRDDARADFTAALECRPHYAPALSNLGNLLLDEGRIEEAVRHYDAAIAADPHYAVAYANLAAAHRRAGRYQEAVRALRRAHRLASRTALARFPIS